MKHFTDREKRIINGILHGVGSDSYILTNAFMDILDNKGIAFNCKSGRLLFNTACQYDIAKMLQFERDFIETALLIKYLTDNQYIYIIKDHDDLPLSIVGDKSDHVISKEIPQEITDIFVSTQNRVVAMNKLDDLVSNTFLTYEGLQLHLAKEQLNTAIGSLDEAKKQSCHAKQTLRWSIVACIIAILSLLASILVPSCSKYMAKAPLETQIDSTNIATEFDITSINTRLDLINNNILQLVEFNANLNNDFKIQPNIQVSPRKKSNSKKTAKQAEKKCSLVQPILKIDTINCDGETYWVLPCPPKKTSTIEEK